MIIQVNYPRNYVTVITVKYIQKYTKMAYFIFLLQLPVLLDFPIIQAIITSVTITLEENMETEQLQPVVFHPTLSK